MTRAAAVVWVALASGCAAGPGYDYTAFRQHEPVSILVLPPLNGSPEVQAPGSWLSTVTLPLAERGYYVFPVHVVAAYMRDNGLPTAGEMHAVALKRIDEVLGADAVLYAQIEDWGSTYFVLTTQVKVTVSFRLVHVKSGDLLWQGRISRTSDNTGGNNGSLLSLVIAAAASQIANSLSDPSRPLSRQVNRDMFYNRSRGLPPGPYAPQPSR